MGMDFLKDKKIAITGGTGSLGKTLVRRILTGEAGIPSRLIVFSRDEAKQHFMRLEHQHRRAATDEVIYHTGKDVLEFRIGDVRDYPSVVNLVRDCDIVINAAALKQVPTCEYFPSEAIRTNIGGAENIVRAIHEHTFMVDKVIGVSTDKACKPINAMGMTKALQERVFIQGNLNSPGTSFICVRYGNVLASRGSVIPLFHDQILKGGPVTITSPDMTRFLLSLDEAVDTVFAAIREGQPGEIYIPRAPSARVVDIATVLIGDRKIRSVVTGIRPGEKIHEILISEAECYRTVERGKWFAILPMLPELQRTALPAAATTEEYSSAVGVMTIEQTAALLHSKKLMVSAEAQNSVELLR
jgi:FlaA1/EpsC-like NDP-sugar epimerase